MKKINLIILILFISLLSLKVNADTGVSGYNFFFFPSSLDGKGIFKNPGAENLKKGEANFGFVSSFARKVIRLNNLATGLPIQLINSVVVNEFKGSVGMTDWASLGVDVPVIFEEGNNNLSQSYSNVVIGDVVLQPKFNLLKERTRIPAISFLGNIWFPTGKRANFSGNENVAGEARVALDKNFGRTLLSANVGYRFIKKILVENSVVNDLFVYGAGMESGLSKRTAIFAELAGGQMFGAESKGFDILEANTGLKFRYNDKLNFLGGIGGSLKGAQAGLGTFRLFAGVNFTATIFVKEKTKQTQTVPEQSEELIHTVYFMFDQSEMMPRKEVELKELVGEFKKNMPKKIFVEGHADLWGEEIYNSNLSEERAINVKKFMVKCGIPEELIETAYFGFSRPIYVEMTFEGQKKNRRVEVKIIR